MVINTFELKTPLKQSEESKYYQTWIPIQAMQSYKMDLEKISEFPKP